LSEIPRKNTYCMFRCYNCLSDNPRKNTHCMLRCYNCLSGQLVVPIHCRCCILHNVPRSNEVRRRNILRTGDIFWNDGSTLATTTTTISTLERSYSSHKHKILNTICFKELKLKYSLNQNRLTVGERVIINQRFEIFNDTCA